MIRIIAGQYKGRFLKVPDASVTRPTMDKVRQAIFSAIKDKPLGSVCVDLFSGSGSMGLEALSRGAKKVFFNDKDHRTFLVLKENVLSLKPAPESYSLDCLDYRIFLKRHSDIKADILFLDPPYRFQVNDQIIKEFVERKMLADNALVVAEQDYPNATVEGFDRKEYRYGAKYVTLNYKKEDI